MTAPIIITADMGKTDQAWANGLRRAHFPAERNYVDAHITLFHHLPPSHLLEIKSRLVALVKPAAATTAEAEQLLQRLQLLAQGLPPSQRPRRWLLCPELERTPLGKWQRSRWRNWLTAVECPPSGRTPLANG
jgi:hypothetical protein